LAFQFTRDPAQRRLLVLAGILFLSYLCVAMALPVVPVLVTGPLGFGNAWAGLAVGSAFFSTIVSRGLAGGFSDRRGGKPAVRRGLIFYVAGALASLLAGLMTDGPISAYEVLIVGRLLIGVGESLVAVGIIAWGIGIVGPARSGKILALVGAAIYGALAVGAPVGLLLMERLGFAGTMAVSAVLPCLGLLAIWRIPGIEPKPAAHRPSFLSVIGKIWLHGTIVGLQGIGFAAIGAFFVLYVMSHGWSHAGLGLSAFGGGFVLVRILFGGLPDKIGGMPVAIGSLAIEAVGQALIWSANDPSLAFLGAFLTGLGCSMVFPAMGREVVRLVEPQSRGTALGGFSAFQDLAYGLTGPITGLLADRAGYESVFLVGAIAASAGFVIAVSLGRARTAVTN
jgi:MFS family permease